MNEQQRLALYEAQRVSERAQQRERAERARLTGGDLPPVSAAFAAFHNDNPHVYAHLVRLARQARRRGASKLGIGQLFEVLRWKIMLATTDPDFKLNNNYRAHYARLIMEREDDLEGVFELRRSAADEVNDL